MITLTSYSQRREIRETLNRLTNEYIEHCNCNGPRPSYEDLKLDQHSLDCGFVSLMKGKETQD